jgi:hypothetical protein
MRNAYPLSMIAAALLLLVVGAALDPERMAAPPPSPRMSTLSGEVLFSDDFSGDLGRWSADRVGVWSIRRGALRADLPDERQQHSFLYAGSPDWTDYAVDFDVCAMRGVDKGVVVRVMKGETGIGVDLRGPGYQDLVLHRREWPLGKVRAINANASWQHLRVEARDNTYRVWLNGALMIEKVDSKRSRPRGGIALAAYTGGVGECTLYYDNVVVTTLSQKTSAIGR